MAAPVGSTGFVMARSGRPASGLTAGALGLAVATTLVLADALGQGAADALAAAEADALAGAAALAETAEADPEGEADAEGEAQVSSADWLTLVTWLLPPTAMNTPRIAASAIGMARGTAMRPSRPSGRRRCLADRCLVGMQSTSI
jgi:hypothetical protein